MIKLNIINMKGFLKAVNDCSGAVNILYSDGKKENINKQYGRQEELLRQYQSNKKSLCLKLEIPNPGDFFQIVAYYAGDC